MFTCFFTLISLQTMNLKEVLVFPALITILLLLASCEGCQNGYCFVAHDSCTSSCENRQCMNECNARYRACEHRCRAGKDVIAIRNTPETNDANDDLYIVDMLQDWLSIKWQHILWILFNEPLGLNELNLAVTIFDWYLLIFWMK